MLELLSTQKGAFDSDSDISVCFPCTLTSSADISDVLNRYPLKSSHTDLDNPDALASPLEDSTIHVMMYIFPRQFGLHNVFTSEVDSQKTAQSFMDYTLREEEIAKKYPSSDAPKIPKRLRGKAVQLVKKLQTLHGRCSYKELVEYYCPVSLPIPSWTAS